jgi:hypothetical protein
MPSQIQLRDQALSAARLLVQKNLQPGEFIGGTVHAAPLAPEGARPLVLAMLRRYATLSASNLMEVCHWGREGVDQAHQVLAELAAEYVNRGEPLPQILALYAAEQLHPGIGRRPGRDRFRFFPQDVCIALLVLFLTELLPLRATRSGRSQIKPSACSVMAVALSEAGIHRGGEAAVQKIWLRYRDMVMSDPSATPAVLAGARLGHDGMFQSSARITPG